MARARRSMLTRCRYWPSFSVAVPGRGSIRRWCWRRASRCRPVPITRPARSALSRSPGLVLLCGAALLGVSWASGAAAMEIRQVVSARGIAAWLVEDHSVPVVTLRFAFPGGAALDPIGKEGTAAMVAELLDEGAG